MHQAHGAFLTEMGRVEFQMLLLMDFLSGTSIEHVFAETTGKPFGEKIKSFKTWCDFGGGPSAQKLALQAIYKDLDELLPATQALLRIARSTGSKRPSEAKAPKSDAPCVEKNRRRIAKRSNASSRSNSAASQPKPPSRRPSVMRSGTGKV